MALEPILSGCLKCCSKIVIEDITGFYNSTTNPTGWNDNSTLYRLSTLGNPHVDEATLTIEFNDELVSTIDVTTTIQNATLPTYELYSYEPTSLQDGIYTFTLTIIDEEGDEIVTELIQTVYCNVECCIQKLAAKYAKELCKGCGYEDKDNYDLAFSLYRALGSVSECNGSEEFNKLLTKLQKICNQTKCGCGC
jgi:hypothetical protein